MVVALQSRKLHTEGRDFIFYILKRDGRDISQGKVWCCI